MQVRLRALLFPSQAGERRARSLTFAAMRFARVVLLLQRWTDGKRWSCSRVMGEYLCYEQVLPGEVLPGTRTK